jgi:hypothetical protein
VTCRGRKAGAADVPEGEAATDVRCSRAEQDAFDRNLGLTTFAAPASPAAA